MARALLIWAFFATISAAVSAEEGALMRIKYLGGAAKCLDGSPAAYYIAGNTTSTKYVIYLEEGGLCEGLADCKKRATSGLGSSTKYPPTIPENKDGILSGPATNPEFASWNRIYVPYCSGDVWAGTMTEAANPWSATDDWKGYFSGHLVVKAVVDDLKSAYGAEHTTEVILTGCSAGGMGTFKNCDFVAGSFPKARAACRPESGYFGLPFKNYWPWLLSSKETNAELHHLAANIWFGSISTYSSAAELQCNSSTHNGTDFSFCEGVPGGCCGYAPYFYPYMKTPTFIVQNTMDSYQVEAQGHAWGFNSRYVSYMQGVIAGSLTSNVIYGRKRLTDGMFATACLAHCNQVWSTGSKVDGKTGAEAFRDWYDGRGPSHMHLDNSSTPTCGSSAEHADVLIV